MYVHVHFLENIVYVWLLKKLKMKVSEIRPQNTYEICIHQYFWLWMLWPIYICVCV